MSLSFSNPFRAIPAISLSYFMLQTTVRMKAPSSNFEASSCVSGEDTNWTGTVAPPQKKMGVSYKGVLGNFSVSAIFFPSKKKLTSNVTHCI